MLAAPMPPQAEMKVSKAGNQTDVGGGFAVGRSARKEMRDASRDQFWGEFYGGRDAEYESASPDKKSGEPI